MDLLKQVLKLKVGETYPPDITQSHIEFEHSYHKKCESKLLKVPDVKLEHIGFFTLKYFDSYHYKCPKCGYESVIFYRRRI